MNLLTLVRRSLRFHARSHLGVFLGAAVGSAALIGALVVGDSVRGSLREAAENRLGKIAYALFSGDRLFQEDVLSRTTTIGRLGARSVSGTNSTQARAVSLMLSGVASRQDGTARANRVNIIGNYTDTGGRGAYGSRDLLELGRNPERALVSPGEVWLNGTLAAQLNAKVGDRLVFRVRKPSALSQDSPMTPRADQAGALRARVAGILAVERLGDFSLQAQAIPPLNAFVNLADLQKAADEPRRANLLLASDLFLDRPTALGRWINRLPRSLAARILSWRWFSGKTTRTVTEPPAEALAELQQHLESHWGLGDAQLSLQLGHQGNEFELTTPRIFLDPAVVAAALTNRPERLRGRLLTPEQRRWLETNVPASTARPILTYLVNQIRPVKAASSESDQQATPYSMVCAAGQPWTPAGLRDDEIILTDWLARDLQAKPGDQVALTYYRADTGVQLLEQTNRFRIHSIVPTELPWADRTLMPDFPGLAKAESTHDWDAGFPLVHKIRDQDEAYWKQWRGTPKAFVTLAAGQKMWANRFGALTAIRFPVPFDLGGIVNYMLYELAGYPPSGPPRTPTLGYGDAVNMRILGALKPEDAGLRFEAIGAQAQAAVNESQDFGGLFIGFSFFLIVAALILMGLLFQFGLEQRTTEVGTLLALGFEPSRVRRLFLIEGLSLAALGGLAGVAGGVAYARLMLGGLNTLWNAAVGGTRLGFHVTGLSLTIGLCAAVSVSAFTIWLTLRRLGRQPAHELLNGVASAQSGVGSGRRRNRWRLGAGSVTIGSGVATLALVAWAVAKGELANPEIFFSAGTLCLIAALAAVGWLLKRLGADIGRGMEAKECSARGDREQGHPQVRLLTSSPTKGCVDRERRPRLTLTSLAVRGVARRRTRSLATAALLACGSFIVVAVGINRLDANLHADLRSSGTGGFMLMGETSLPVLKDLNTTSGQEFYGLAGKTMTNVSFVPFRVREGDEASCLNLNRAQQPLLWGVTPEALQTRHAFTFARTLRPVPAGQEWSLLHRPPTETEIPAIGDDASIVWALGKKVGDVIEVRDEAGRTVKLRLVGSLANSILQGKLVIAEDEFVKLYPSQGGYRAYLIDAPTNRVTEVSAELSRQMSDVGLEMVPTTRRLAQLNAVQNTYLSTFQVLGGLGLLLGSAGLGVVLLRNVLERRSEFALLLAVGFDKALVRKQVLTEHVALLLLGLAAGLVAALVAVFPALLSPGASLPLRSLGLTLVGALATGLVWTWLAARAALRGRMLETLRNE